MATVLVIKCLIMRKCSRMVQWGDQSSQPSPCQRKMRLVELELCEKRYILLLPRLHFQMVPNQMSDENICLLAHAGRVSAAKCSLAAEVQRRNTFIRGAPSPSRPWASRGHFLLRVPRNPEVLSLSQSCLVSSECPSGVQAAPGLAEKLNSTHWSETARG